MTIDPAALLGAIALPVAAGLIAWGSAMSRLRALEKRCGELSSMDKALAQLQAELAVARRDQGERIGVVEDRVAMLRGQFDGFDRGRRSRTAAHGNPVKDGGE